MNKTIVAVVGILATALLIGLYIWSSHHRYYIMTGDRGIAYEVDRKTGQSWMLYGGEKIPHEGGAESRHKEQELPYSDAAKITGNAGLSYGLFSGRLYNGSDWVVTRVVINVSAKEADDTIRWSRDFSEAVSIRPLSTESFSVIVAGGHGVTNAPWTIKKVFGYKE